MPPAPTHATARRANRVSATLLFLFSAFVIVEARTLPYWTLNAPGPGFVPLWLGVLLACASVVMFAGTFAVRQSEDAGWLPDRPTRVRIATVVLLTTGGAVLSFVVGLVLAGGVFMGATLAYLRPGHPRANVTTAVLTPIVIWLLFVRWLGVPLPPGPLGF